MGPRNILLIADGGVIFAISSSFSGVFTYLQLLKFIVKVSLWVMGIFLKNNISNNKFDRPIHNS